MVFLLLLLTFLSATSAQSWGPTLEAKMWINISTTTDPLRYAYIGVGCQLAMLDITNSFPSDLTPNLAALSSNLSPYCGLYLVSGIGLSPYTATQVLVSTQDALSFVTLVPQKLIEAHQTISVPKFDMNVYPVPSAGDFSYGRVSDATRVCPTTLSSCQDIFFVNANDGNDQGSVLAYKVAGDTVSLVASYKLDSIISDAVGPRGTNVSPVTVYVTGSSGLYMLAFSLLNTGSAAFKLLSLTKTPSSANNDGFSLCDSLNSYGAVAAGPNGFILFETFVKDSPRLIASGVGRWG